MPRTYVRSNESRMGNPAKAVAFEMEHATCEGECIISHRNPGDREYPRVAQWVNGKQRAMPVHRLVMLLKEGPLPEGKATRHLCGNKRCINPEHLRYDSYAENGDDVAEHDGCTQHKLTPSQVADIRRRYRPGKNQYQNGNRDALAAEYGVHPDYLRQVARGRGWRRVEA